MKTSPGAGRANPPSVREDNVSALDLLLLEAHQSLAVRALDRQLAGDGKPQVRVSAAKSRLLERNQSDAPRIAASDRQIPVGLRGDVNGSPIRSFSDDAFRSRCGPARGLRSEEHTSELQSRFGI